MSKNAEGWIRHNNKKQPVDDRVVVEIRTRGGDYELCQAYGFAWDATGENQIMAYRLHKPAEQVEQVEAEQVMRDCVEKCASTESAGELLYDPIAQGPLQWRDRITELDEERKTIDALYQVNTARIETERAELVQKLASEGFALIGRVVEPAEDMSDWRNWKAGDRVEVLSGSECDTGIFPVCVLEGRDYDGYLPAQLGEAGWPELSYMRWHSRPSA